MGDRVSIQFENKQTNEKSIVLFSHWGGMELVKEAKQYVKKLKTERTGESYPLDRLEPQTVIIDFIRHITKGMKRVESDLYLGVNGTDGDNSNNGHHTIKM